MFYETTNLGEINFSVSDSDNETIKIPKEINGHKVTSVATNAFNRIKAKEIIVPTTIEEISISAFECANTKKISFASIKNSELKTIKMDAFKRARIKDVCLPDNVNRICISAFMESAISKIKFPMNLTVIEDSVCSRCYCLEEIIFPEKLEYINQQAFVGCTAIKNIELPNNLKAIRDGAFMGCIALRKVKLPDSIKEISETAFTNCICLKEINIPKGCAFNYSTFETSANLVISYQGNMESLKIDCPDYENLKIFVLNDYNCLLNEKMLNNQDKFICNYSATTKYTKTKIIEEINNRISKFCDINEKLRYASLLNGIDKIDKMQNMLDDIEK